MIGRLQATVFVCLVRAMGQRGACVQAQPVGQLSAPVVGGTAGLGTLPPPKIITGSQDLEIMRHRNFTGKACLEIGGYARPLQTDSRVLDHIIVANSICPQPLKVQVCYFGSRECIEIQVPGYGRKEAILGTLAGMKDFRYEFRERF
jgi:hypothetical protein